MKWRYPRALLFYGTVIFAVICAGFAAYLAWRCAAAEARTRNVILYATTSALRWNAVATHLRDDIGEDAVAFRMTCAQVDAMGRYQMNDKKSAIVLFQILYHFPDVESNEGCRGYIDEMRSRWTGKEAGFPDKW